MILTGQWQECTFREALMHIAGQAITGRSVACEDRDGDWLRIRLACGVQIGIRNGSEPVPYSDVTPDLNYDPPHVMIRRIVDEPARTIKPGIVSCNAPPIDNSRG